jgi:transposase
MIEGKRGEFKQENKTFNTMTNDLLWLKDWSRKEGVTQIAIESTGVYWKPIFNILEDSFEMILANARHIKHGPGRKTDVENSQRLWKLLHNGLIKASFIPPKDIRELRDLTLFKKKLVQSIISEKDRIQKVLEDDNIKLSSVANDIFGESGMEMMKALMERGKFPGGDE